MRFMPSALLAAMLLSGGALAQTAAPTTAPSTTIRPGAVAPSAAPTSAAATSVAPAALFAVGDVVELRSGSPHMTVVEIGADLQVVFYSRGKGLQRERLPLSSVEKSGLNDADEYAPAAANGGRQINRSPRDEGASSDRRRERRYDDRCESRYGCRYEDGYDRSANEDRDRGRRYYQDDDDDRR